MTDEARGFMGCFDNGILFIILLIIIICIHWPLLCDIF